MVRSAIGITANNRFFEMTILRPMSSAARKTTAKR